MALIFVSYRRQDAAGHAGALVRFLETRFSSKDVFMDIDDLPGGKAFPEEIAKTIEKSHVVLVLIGHQWLVACDDTGKRRIDNPIDHVRREVELGLRSSARVIPILIEGAKMPAVSDLPAEISDLAHCNAVGLSNRNWDRDAGHIAGEISKALFAPDLLSRKDTIQIPDGVVPSRPRLWSFALFGAFFVVSSLVSLGLAATIYLNDKSFKETASVTDGIVVDFVEVREQGTGSQTNRGPDSKFYPIIEFVDLEGSSVYFKGGMGSNPPAYDIGDTVEVLYQQEAPEDARIAGQALVGSYVFGGLGLVFGGIGGGVLLWSLKRRSRWKKIADLLKLGRPIMTTFKEAKVVNVNVNGKQPYCIVTSWDNPLTGDEVLFKSEWVWKNPTDLLKNRSLLVLVDPNNFGRYVMDVSLLPESFLKIPKPRAKIRMTG